MSNPHITSSIPQALWLMSKGFEPFRAARSNDGSNAILIFFSTEAHDALDDFRDAKKRLWKLTEALQ